MLEKNLNRRKESEETKVSSVNGKMKIPINGPSISNVEDEGILVLDPELEHEIVIPKVIRDSIILQELDEKIREKMGYFAGRGALFHGFQGVGKTCLIKQLARDYNAKIVFVDKEMSSSKIKRTFDYTKKLCENGERIFLVIDEIDDFGQKEYVKYSGGMSKIISLMTELEGIKNGTSSKNKLYIFATTNYLDNVDSRLLRPGRLEEMVEIPLPDKDARRKISEIHAKNAGQGLEKYIDFISKNTNGFTPADIRGVFKHLLPYAIKGKLNKDMVKKVIEEYEPSVKRGFEFFKDPEYGLDYIVGRDIYLNFFKDILNKKEKGGEKFLLYGPRGTGKTLTPEVLADYFGFNYVAVKGSELQEGIVGEGTKKIKKLFDLASKSKPCIILLDEIDGIISARGTISHKDDETAYLNSLLARKNLGLYIFATINEPQKVNPTFLTRFEHRIFYGLPDTTERKSYLELNFAT